MTSNSRVLILSFTHETGENRVPIGNPNPIATLYIPVIFYPLYIQADHRISIINQYHVQVESPVTLELLTSIVYPVQRI